MEISCAITAGGKAKRFNGITKAFIEVDGERIIDKNLGVLKTIFQNIIIISNSPSEFIDYKDIKIYKDYYHEIGPIAGLHSALRNCKGDAVFLISSDLPNISLEIINSLIKRYLKLDCDIIIPKIGNKIEPLFGIYSTNILNKLEQYIEKKESYAMRDFFKEVNTHFLELSNNEHNKGAFININEPKDLIFHSK